MGKAVFNDAHVFRLIRADDMHKVLPCLSAYSKKTLADIESACKTCRTARKNARDKKARIVAAVRKCLYTASPVAKQRVKEFLGVDVLILYIADDSTYAPRTLI